MKIKKRERRRALLLFIILIIVFIIINLLKPITSNTTTLLDIGYEKDEIEQINKKLDKDEIAILLENEYSPYVIDITSHQYYIKDNLEKYLSISGSNLDDLIAVANIGGDDYENIRPANLEDNYSILVNKHNYLEEDYTPDDLVKVSEQYAYAGHTIREEVYEKYLEMWNAAKKEGLTLLINSSFRTYENQKEQHAAYGDNYAARPGYSEHQTGLAIDITTYGVSGSDFHTTAEFYWLQENAHKYGFILRYPEGKQMITGYSYESWHYRYITTELATKVKGSNLTYDEYYAFYCEYKKEC